MIYINKLTQKQSIKKLAERNYQIIKKEMK